MTAVNNELTKWTSLICQVVIWIGVFLILVTSLVVNGDMYFPFVSPKGFYFFALTQIIFSAWLILILFEPKFRLKMNAVFLALAIFVGVMFLSAFLGVDFQKSFWGQYDRMDGVLTWLHLLAFFTVLSSFFMERKYWLWLFSFSVIVASIIGLVGLADRFGLVETTLNMQNGSTLGNTSYLGAYLLFNLFFALHLFFAVKERWWKIFAVSNAGVIFLVLLTYFSFGNARAATLSATGGIILAGLIYLIFSYSPRLSVAKGISGVLLALAIFVSLFAGYSLFQEGSVVNKWFAEWGHGQARLVVWEEAQQGFQERPFLGWGPENFDIVHARYFNPCLFVEQCGGEVWFDRAHNLILDKAATVGIAGLLSYALLLLAFLFVLWRGFLKRNNTSLITASLFSGLIAAYLVQNMTFFDIVPIQVMLFFALAFGGFLAVDQNGDGKDFPENSVFLGKGANYTLTILVVLGLAFSLTYFVVQPMRSNLWANQALKGQVVVDQSGQVVRVERMLAHGSEEKIEAYEKTLNISPMGNQGALNHFANTTLEFSRQANLEEISLTGLFREIDFLTAKLEKELERNPLDFKSRMRLSQLLNQKIIMSEVAEIPEGERESLIEKAVDSAKTLTEISPLQLHAFVVLSQSKVFQEEPEEALDVMMQAIDLEPRFYETHLFAANIALNLLGDEEKALEIAKKAISTNPEWRPEWRDQFTSFLNL